MTGKTRRSTCSGPTPPHWPYVCLGSCYMLAGAWACVRAVCWLFCVRVRAVPVLPTRALYWNSCSVHYVPCARVCLLLYVGLPGGRPCRCRGVGLEGTARWLISVQGQPAAAAA